MLDQLKKEFLGKDILLLGFGAEGRSSLTLLQELNTARSIGIADKSEQLDAPQGVNLHLGGDYFSALSQYDLILKSPGIPLPPSIWKEHGEKITSQTELFLKYFPGLTIGVTGTKGKTTTSSLLFAVLSKRETPVHLLGNIGKPIFSELSSIQDSDCVLLELSSHQLHHIRYAPKISILLNLYPEHLEYYESFGEYRDAKLSILQASSAPTIAFVNSQLAETTKQFHATRDIRLVDVEASPSFSDKIPVQLSGPHLRENLCFVDAVASYFQISEHDVIEALTSFTLPPHRTEVLGEFRGVQCINDSAATIPQATISALEMFPETRTLIVGGFNRGIDLSLLTDYLKQQDSLFILCLPETGDVIQKELFKAGFPEQQIFSCKDLQEAVEKAFEVTPSGSTCLFSPAAASYHLYRNYAERGEEFRELVFQQLSSDSQLRSC